MALEEEAVVRLRAIDETERGIRSISDNMRRLQEQAKAVLGASFTASEGQIKNIERSSMVMGRTFQQQLEVMRRGSEEIKKIGRAAEDTSNKTKRAMDGVDTAVSSVIGRYLTWGAAIETVRRSFMGFADMDRQLRRIAIGANVSVHEMHQMLPFIRELSDQTGESTSSLLTGFNTLREYGNLTLQQTRQIFPEVARGAVALGVSSETMAKTQATLMHNLNLGTHDIEKTNSMILRATTDYKLNIQETMPMLGRLTEAAAHVGLTGQEGLATILSMIGVLKNAGLSSQQASQQVMQFLTVMSSPQFSQALMHNKDSIMKMFEMAQAQGQNSFAAFMNMAMEAEQRLGGSFVENLFGRGPRGAGAAYRKFKEAFATMGIDIRNLSGVTREQFQQAVKMVTEGSLTDWQRLKNQFDSMTVELGRLMEQLGASSLINETATLLKKLRQDITAIVAFIQGVKKWFSMSVEERLNFQKMERERGGSGIPGVSRDEFDQAIFGTSIPGRRTEFDKRFHGELPKGGDLGNLPNALEEYAKKRGGFDANVGYHFSGVGGGQGFGGGGGGRYGQPWTSDEVAAVLAEILKNPSGALLRVIKGDENNLLRDDLRAMLGIQDEEGRRDLKANTDATDRLANAVERLLLEKYGYGGGTVSATAFGTASGYSGDGGYSSPSSSPQSPSTPSTPSPSPPSPPAQTPAQVKPELDKAIQEEQEEAWKNVPLPGMAKGGSFTVGGSGLPDSKIFRVSPGERVTVQTKAQQAAARARTKFWAGVPRPPGTSGDSRGQRYNYFQSQGVQPPSRESLSTLDTSFGRVVAHPDAATDIQGFMSDLSEAGAPISRFGSYNRRQKRWGGGWSSHAYATAFDIDDQQYLSPEMKQWIANNPERWEAIKSSRNVGQPLPSNDPAHVEWRGPRPETEGGPPGYSVGPQVAPPVPYTNESMDAARAVRRDLERPIKLNFDMGEAAQFSRAGLNEQRVANIGVRDTSWTHNADMVA